LGDPFKKLLNIGDPLVLCRSADAVQRTLQNRNLSKCDCTTKSIVRRDFFAWKYPNGSLRITIDGGAGDGEALFTYTPLTGV
jgi:hypothetical protein